jgi:hypothetical protein
MLQSLNGIIIKRDTRVLSLTLGAHLIVVLIHFSNVLRVFTGHKNGTDYLQINSIERRGAENKPWFEPMEYRFIPRDKATPRESLETVAKYINAAVFRDPGTSQSHLII